MATGRNGQVNQDLPSLQGTLAEGEATLDLNAAGILVDQTRAVADLYIEHGDWETVRSVWFDERHSERSSYESVRRTFSVVRSRLEHAGSGLPPIAQLPEILDSCRSDQDRRQVLFCYLVADDGLLRYVIHEYLRELSQAGTDSLEFANDRVYDLLDRFRFESGESLDVAESTRHRWAKGFRSVLRQIGVIPSKQATTGEVPSIGDVPLEVTAYWSWDQYGTEWLTAPIGWRYLFQPEPFWEPQSCRLAKSPRWSSHDVHGRLWYEPADGFHAALAEAKTR